MKKNIETKIVCANCGAEIVIPANEVQGVIGTVVGKDSGLGTVVLPTVNNCGCGCGSPKSGKMTPKAALAQLMALAKSNPGMQQMAEVLAGQIEQGGYIDVVNIVRRWIPSQCLRMVYSDNGFHKSLSFKGYSYSWEVLLNELKKQVKLRKNDDLEELSDRKRWYNKTVAIEMADHYFKSLQQAIGQMPIKHHENRKYVRICCWLNKGKGVHIDELHKLYNPIFSAQMDITKAQDDAALVAAVEKFNKIRKDISNFEPREMSSAFMNAYKAAGAYYTMKDLILFESCKMKVDGNGNTMDNRYYYGITKNTMKFVNRDKSLEALEKRVDDMVKTNQVADYGYMMLGLLKHFLEYNKFDFQKAKKEWAVESDKRKQQRMAKKSVRRYKK